MQRTGWGLVAAGPNQSSARTTENLAGSHRFCGAAAVRAGRDRGNLGRLHRADSFGQDVALPCAASCHQLKGSKRSNCCRARVFSPTPRAFTRDKRQLHGAESETRNPSGHDEEIGAAQGSEPPRQARSKRDGGEPHRAITASSRPNHNASGVGENPSVGVGDRCLSIRCAAHKRSMDGNGQPASRLESADQPGCMQHYVVAPKNACKPPDRFAPSGNRG